MTEYEQVEWDELLREKQLDFILTRDQLVDIIKQLGHTIDDEDYILDRSTGERTLAIDVEEIKASDLAAALPGSEVFLRKNIASFSQYLAERGL